ncbi:unnamed protein product [Caenorhabditis bovis]|uniref:Arrestin C-terminal-like domain-containing protein n=1 Tax=Caenorhabditis bovis TaxID=2654633 RepID=A0A8S1EDB3_9PELO|nr:unnamed protein product [Caenorhabditis bovis]
MAALKIELADSRDFYFPGQTINAVATFKTSEPYKATEVRAYCKGEARISFRENSARYNRIDILDTNDGYVSFYTRHAFIDDQSLLWACADGSENIPPGEYKWNFSFTLPDNCEPSFQSQNGSIKYSIKVEINRPRALDKTETCPIIVLRPSLGNIPTDLKPLDNEVTSDLGASCCGLFGSGQIKVKFHMPKTRIRVGETVNMEFEVNNQSTTAIRGIHTYINSKAVMRAEHSEHAEEEIGRMIEDMVLKSTIPKYELKEEDPYTAWKQSVNFDKPKKSKEFKYTHQFVFPPLAATFNGGNEGSLVSTSYTMEVSLDIKVFTVAPKFRFPIEVYVMP